MSTDPYQQIVRYYDAENATKDDDLPMYIDLMDNHGERILVAGCGTGRVAIPLAHNGAKIVGVDVSDAMLDRARARTTSSPPREGTAEWVTADVRTLDLGQQFDIVMFPYNGLMHLTTLEDQIAVVERLGAHVAPDGVLVLDLHNPIDLFMYEDSNAVTLERTFTDHDTGHTVMQQSLLDIDRGEQLMHVTWLYDRLDETGRVTRSVVPMTFRIALPAEVTLLLRLAGFNDVTMYGDYDFEPFYEDSLRMVVVAKRESGE